LVEAQESENMVATSRWRFEYNLNTLVILFGFAGGLIVWGALGEGERQPKFVDRSIAWTSA
jgi:hypothetical protein